MSVCTVCNRRYYVIRYEDYNGMTFVHTDVVKWNKEIKREFILDLNDLLFLRGDCLYVMNSPDGKEKREKFIRMMGFSFLHTATTDCGDRDIFVRAR